MFLTFAALVAKPKKLFYTVANPARGLLNREGNKKKRSGNLFHVLTIWQNIMLQTPGCTVLLSLLS